MICKNKKKQICLQPLTEFTISIHIRQGIQKPADLLLFVTATFLKTVTG
jgi:hypothetical protein